VKTTALASMHTKEVKANTVAKETLVRAQNSSRNALVGKLSLTKILYEKKIRTKLDFLSNLFLNSCVL